MKRLLKLVVITTLVLISVYLFLVFFSGKQTAYFCQGRFDKMGPQVLYLKVTEYRFWVHLWNKFDGDIKIEIPNKHYDYISEVTEVGDLLQMTRNGQVAGQLSKLSGALVLHTYGDFYDGNCQKVEGK